MTEYTYFIPGYGGHCPELRDRYGETFGRASRGIIKRRPHLHDRLSYVLYNPRRPENAKRSCKKPCRNPPDSKKECYCDPKHKGPSEEISLQPCICFEIDDECRGQNRVCPVCGGKRRTSYETDDGCRGQNREQYEGDHPFRDKIRICFQRGDKSTGEYREHYEGDHKYREIHHKCFEGGDKFAKQYRTQYGSGDSCKATCGGDSYKAGSGGASCKEGCSVGQPRSRTRPTSNRPALNRTNCDDSDRKRKVDRGCICPSLIFIDGYEDCPPPKGRANRGSKMKNQEHCSSIAVPCPCVHVKRSREKKDTVEKEDPRSKERPWFPHPFPYDEEEDAREDADSKECSWVPRPIKDPRIMRVSRLIPYRQGGVIPKYAGHIPGMQFSFGECYGPLSDRLLRRHHDTMRRH